VKKLGCTVLGCFGALAVVVIGLIGLSWWLAPEPVLEGAGDSEAEPYQEVEALNQFRQDEAGERFRLSYGFIDYSGRKQQVSCTVNREDYLRDVDGFGYFENQANQEINRRLAARMEEEGRARGVLSYFKIEVYGQGGYRWHWDAPGDVAPAIEERIHAFHDWLDKDFPEEVERITRRYYEERGFLLKENEISVDYEEAVLHGTRSLEDCYQALRRVGNGDSERRLLGLFLAFFQELRYEIPPDVDRGGRHTLGFRVPSAVMVQGAGDCDSKAAAFCALWRHFPKRSILILVPEHALVGVEGKPRADEAYVRLGNRYFVLCEVAGPGKIPPGAESISGSFEYVMIEPVNPSPAG
jgi:hypothetical protein